MNTNNNVVDFPKILLEPAPKDGANKPLDFKFFHNAEIIKGLRPIEWRIQGILPDSVFYYNFGEPGHFKTFIELDRLLCIASGLNYHGHEVRQGTVFYIAGEGQQGIGRRIAAWHIAHSTKAADIPFFVSKTPTQLMNLKAVKEVQRAVDEMTKEYGPPAVVHMDSATKLQSTEPFEVKGLCMGTSKTWGPADRRLAGATARIGVRKRPRSTAPHDSTHGGKRRTPPRLRHRHAAPALLAGVAFAPALPAA